MIDLSKFKFREAPRECCDDPSRIYKVSDPSSTNSKILTNPKIEEHRRDIFNILSPQKRINQQKGLSMFGDHDGDGSPNILDCDPYDKNKQHLGNKKSKKRGQEWFKNIMR